MRVREVGTQPLAGFKLRRVDESRSVATFAPREPSERAFAVVDRDCRAPSRRNDVAGRSGVYS